MKTATVLSLGALALAAPTQDSAAPAAKIALDRRRHEPQKNADGTVNMDWFLSEVRHVTRKYNKDIALPDFIELAGLKKRESSESLTDNVVNGTDEDYYGVGYIGAAKQEFTFDFDTGSSDTFVPGPSCGASQGCAGTTRYNQEGTDEGNTTSVMYGSGDVTGENYFDRVTVAGLTADHQNIISLTSAQGFQDLGSDGLMGMGFQSIASSGQPPYFFTLVSEKKVDPTEFSFYLGRAASNTQGNSELTLGGRDSSKYTGSFTTVPVTDPGYWQVAIDGASVGSSSTPLGFTSAQAAIDTGTTLIIAPSDAAASIFSQIPGSFPILSPPYTFYSFPCSSSPEVNLIFGGKAFTINPLDFNLGEVSSGFELPILDDLLPQFGGPSCLAAIYGGDIDPNTPLYVVGDAFLKNWYSTFTVQGSGGTVSFAKAV